MGLEVVGEIRAVRTIAVGRRIREYPRLVRAHGHGRWRKLKGIARVKIEGGIVLAEIHWYEASGIGRRELKIKRILAD